MASRPPTSTATARPTSCWPTSGSSFGIGNPTWEKFVIAENLTKRDNVCIAAQDIDGDGKCEVAVGGDWDPSDRENSGAVFYLVAPDDRTQKWEAVKLHAEPTVHRMRWMKLEARAWGLVVAPLHGRGKDANAGSRILLYHAPADPHQKWETELLGDSMHATHNLDVFGVRMLLLAGREGLQRIHWSARKRDAILERFPLEGTQSAGEVRAMTGNRIAIVEPMHGNQVVVYQADRRTVLCNDMDEGHGLAVGDLLGTGGQQVVVGWRGAGGGVRMFSPMTDDWSDFLATPISDYPMTCEDLCLADLNTDGKLDIIASGRATKNVVVYWNETPPLSPSLPSR